MAVHAVIRGETVTLIRKGAATGRDADGNDTFTPAEVAAPGAVFSPGGTVENPQGGDLTTETPSFTWVNNVPSLTAVDRIRRGNGETYEIDGVPGDFQSPFSTTRVLQVHVKRVTG